MANTHFVSFSGTNQWAERVNHANLDQDSMTVQFWIKLDTTASPQNGSYCQIVATNDGSPPTNKGYYIWFGDVGGAETNALEIAFHRATTNATWIKANFGGFDNTWHHVAVVFDTAASSVITVYLDGNTTPVTADTSANGSGSHTIGSSDFAVACTGAGAYDMNGSLDDLRIYTVARTASAIAGDYACDITAETDIGGHYRFDNGVTDTGGAGLNLTANGTPTYTTTGLPFTGSCTAATANSNFLQFFGPQPQG